MEYAIEWDPVCFSQLDGMHAAGATYEQLKVAVRRVATELLFDAEAKGEPLAEGLRKLDVLPVRVYFHADLARRTVVVDGMRWIGGFK